MTVLDVLVVLFALTLLLLARSLTRQYAAEEAANRLRNENRDLRGRVRRLEEFDQAAVWDRLYEQVLEQPAPVTRITSTERVLRGIPGGAA